MGDRSGGWLIWRVGEGEGVVGVGKRGGREGEGEACDSCQCSHMSNTPMHDVHMLYGQGSSVDSVALQCLSCKKRHLTALLSVPL